MRDRIRSRREFLREDSATRVRLLAANLATIGDRFLDGADPASARDAIDDSTWMIEWAVPEETPEVQRLLVELQTSLFTWRDGLGSLGSDAGERARIWAERLRALADASSRARQSESR